MLARTRVDAAYRRLIEASLLPALLRAGVTPDRLTGGGLAFSAVAGVAAPWFPFAAGLALLAAGLLDTLDGAVARAAGRETRSGAFLDSTVDRYGEFLVLLGVWGRLVRTGAGGWGALWVFLALQGSLMVSYARARAESLDYPLRGGIFERPERVILLILGLLASPWERALGFAAGGLLFWTAVLLGCGANATALGRAARARRALAGKTAGEPGP